MSLIRKCQNKSKSLNSLAYGNNSLNQQNHTNQKIELNKLDLNPIIEKQKPSLNIFVKQNQRVLKPSNSHKSNIVDLSTKSNTNRPIWTFQVSVII